MPADWLLAIESSTRGGAIALLRGEECRYDAALADGQRVTSHIQPLIVDAVRAVGISVRDIRLVAFSQGPGSFTGLRVAATLARMLQATIGCDVVGVPTLQVIAENTRAASDPPRNVAVLLDARRDESFAAWYALVGDKPGDTRLGCEPAIVRAGEWMIGVPRPTVCLGSGVASHRGLIDASGAEIGDESLWAPRAAIVGLLGRQLANHGQILSPERIIPHYLRPPECEEVYDARRAAAIVRHQGAPRE